jgi:hypothetical protein
MALSWLVDTVAEVRALQLSAEKIRSVVRRWTCGLDATVPGVHDVARDHRDHSVHEGLPALLA